MEQAQASLKVEQLVALSANTLHQLFFEAKSDLAKSRFKQLNKSKSAILGNLELNGGVQVSLRLSLESSDYVGKLNYQAFRKFVEGYLRLVQEKLDKNLKIPLRNDQTGQRYLFELPVPIMEGNTLNVLMIGISTAVDGELELQLMFMEPDQFKRPQ